MEGKMKVIGLTGGVATGKSLVTGEFRRLGAYVIDADLVARRVCDVGTRCYKRIVEEFGGEVVTEEGDLDRAALGDIVFRDEGRRELLNSIVHPEVRLQMWEEVERVREEGERRLIILDVPLLIEGNLQSEVDGVIVVYTTPVIQLERLMARDGIGEAEANLIISSQMDIREKRGYGDFVIDNSGTSEETLREVALIYKELTAREGAE